jgi:pyrroloquinoline-quinone synthase
MNWVQPYADQLLHKHSLQAHPYFAALTSGAMTRTKFLQSQRQFFHAVRFFSQAMAALLARLPDSGSRQVLMHNLAEEHGWDEEEGGLFQPGMAHDRTFLRFLDSFSSQPEPAEAEVRAFNLALYGACAQESVAFAFASLGMIEYAFADISALIGESVVGHGWVEPEKLVHYSLHAEIDKRHAAEFFEVVENQGRLEVEAGMEFGWYIFAQLYRGLWERP